MEPQEQAEQLVNAVLPLAEQMLKEHGEFLPYAGVIKADGQIEVMQFSPEGSEPKTLLTAKQMHQGATEMLREGAQTGDYTTTALVSNVYVVKPGTEDKVEAVAVSIDDAEGNSMEVFFPYTISEGAVGFGTAFAQKGTHYIFGQTQ